MKYMLLIYNDPALEPAYGTPEFAAMMSGLFAANEKMAAAGVLRGGEGLQGVETATSLRIKGAKVETMDGPFAETKEQLGGFYVFDCANLDDAIRYAAMIPTAAFGSIEIRPILELRKS